MAEGARLESVYTARYPGFESLSLRHTSLQQFTQLAPKQIDFERLGSSLVVAAGLVLAIRTAVPGAHCSPGDGTKK